MLEPDIFTRAMRRVLWVIAIGILILTRVPLVSQYLSIDGVNLAFSLERFSPLEDQPQPPGYPFFVAFARVVNLPFHNAETTFFLIAIMVSALCLPAAYAVGRHMDSAPAGFIAAFLLLLNPAFWQAGLEGPLRPHLALFSLLTAYCCWRVWDGESRFVLWGAVAFGIGSGFRPDLLVYLFPLWFATAVFGTRSFRTVMQGILILMAIVTVWVTALALAVGGFRPLYDLISTYLIDQSRTNSALMGAPLSAWLRQASHLIAWNGFAIVVWIWALPLAWAARERSYWTSRIAFVLLWALPGLIFQILVHGEEAGHTIFGTPAWCVLGGVVIAVAIERVSPKYATPITVGIVAGLLLVNSALFLDRVRFPSRGGELVRAVEFSARESSYTKIRYLNNIHRPTMKELQQNTPTDRPWIIVSNDDVNRKDWFMNWRIVRYYLPRAQIWVAADQKTVVKVQRDRIEGGQAGLTIPVPRGGRVIWLLEVGGALYQSLLDGHHAVADGMLLYTDVANDAQPFQAWGYTFNPQ